jgi:ATP-dependent DNA helicase RecQ
MTPLQALQKYFGYTQFRHQQEAIIKQIMSGGDALVLMPTGGGKSLCYQLPAVLLPGLTIVISPLIALMKDQVDSLNINGIPAAFINSSQTTGEQQDIYSRLKAGQIKLLYLAPERLFSSESRLVTFLKALPVSLIAIDEAHCISHWGHDFRPEYLMLSGFKTEFPTTPVIALTATADQLTQQDIKEKLALHQPAEYVSSFNRPNISYRVAPKKNNYQQLLNFLDTHKDDSGIIYCLSRASTEDLAADLRTQGYQASAYHAGLDQETKANNQDKFLRDEVKIMVATIAFGMGINKSNVRYVVHYDLPKNIEGYYQETGRAGRDGLPSEALLFYSQGDAIKLQRFAKVDGNEEQSRIMLKKLDDMVKYCQLQTCRRQYLMQYFNEPFPSHCGSCDVCLTEYTMFDGTVLAQKALSAVTRLNQRFGVTYVIDLLRGSKSEKIREEHKQLKTYGIGADVSKADWQRYIAQLVNQGLLQVTDDGYNVLKLTPASDEVLKGRRKVEFALAEATEVAEEIQTPVYEAGLLQDLKSIRFNLAMNENVPAYIILSDATLMEIATYLPQTPKELGRISGFGEVKLVRYGDAFLQATLAYCHQHNLSSKIDSKQAKAPTRSKTTTPRPSSGKTQRESFDLYRAGMSIGEIAGLRGIAATTVESHLCSFIQTGEMEVHEMVSAEKVPFIQDAIANYGADRLAPLKEVLGDGYTYAEIKAVVSWTKREK